MTAKEEPFGGKFSSFPLQMPTVFNPLYELLYEPSTWPVSQHGLNIGSCLAVSLHSSKKEKELLMVFNDSTVVHIVYSTILLINLLHDNESQTQAYNT